MKGETSSWIFYADENLAVARLSLTNGYLNACLQNVQQAVEKLLKAVVVERGLPFKKTHSITEIEADLSQAGIAIGITGEECALLDAIYLPSKYPLASVLPDAPPTGDICQQCLEIADRVAAAVRGELASGKDGVHPERVHVNNIAPD